MRQAIGDFSLRRLQESGIKHIFGVPGDYNLAFAAFSRAVNDHIGLEPDARS